MVAGCCGRCDAIAVQMPLTRPAIFSFVNSAGLSGGPRHASEHFMTGALLLTQLESRMDSTMGSA